jgi:serine/threonine-protein kinase
MSGDGPMTQADDIELEQERVSEEPLLEAGTEVDGKYTIQRALGRGGTGTVYEARHATIGHRVALKIVNADRAQRPETLARFQTEAQICGAIRHPNVGQIYDVGTYEGKPYMVLELHEGQSMANVLSESLLPIPAILEIAMQVLSALAAVHDSGVVHRDVKPDNAMLVRALNGDIVVKLVDFGISKVITTDIRERTLTREGSILGSPDYMAPEQLRGHEVDARTDLYAVGVLLYEAVAGRPPFDAENLSDLMVAILRDPVVPPSELRTDCPPELDALILKALSRAPKERFQSAVEMARQLEQIQTVLRQRPASIAPELRKPMPRREQRPTRARRALQKPAEPDAAELEAAETLPAAASVEAVPPPEAPRPRRKLPLGLLLTVGGVLALAITSAVALRGADEKAQLSVAPPPPPAPVSATAAEAKPALPVEPAVAPVLAEVPPVVEEVAEAPPQEVDRRAKNKRDSRPKKAEGEAISASVDAPAAPTVREQLDAASSAFVLGQMPRAKELYQQILERAPSQPDAWRGLGLVCSRMGQNKDAERAFERYLELRPGAPDAERIREQLAKVR